MSNEQLGYSTAPSHAHTPLDPPGRSDQAQRSFTLSAAELAMINLAQRAMSADNIVQDMRSETSSFTGQPHSPTYKPLLDRRLQLPVYEKLKKFCKLFSKNRLIIVTGGTGCGKTTQIPQFVAYCDLPHAKGKMVAITQPRRVTTVSLARRVASEMDVELGQQVGYSIRFDDKTTPGVTFLRYMTDGKLLQEAMYDPDFSRYSTIIIDEAHERTVATDILMALLKSVVKKRSDLRVIIMSATLDAPTFRQYFSLDDGTTRAPLLHIPGHTYPVETLHLHQSLEDYLQTAIEVIIRIHSSHEPGDILLFLTGEDEIEMACQRMFDRVEKARKDNPKIGRLDCIPLYSLLPPEKQQRIFDPPSPPRVPGGRPGRKVIVATNIAETSLTIDGIYFVVDPGYSKQKVYIPRTKMSVLRTMKISKASAQQRVGRAGRTGPGKCFRLYTAEDFHKMVEKTRPEVLNIDLSDAVLTLLNIGIKAEDLGKFDFIDAPTPERVACALEALGQLGAVDKEQELTNMGRMMTVFPLVPHLSKALLESVNLKSSEPVLTIAAMLSVQSVWRRPYGEQQKADRAKARLSVPGGDHLTLLNVYDQYIKNSCNAAWAEQNYLSARTLEEAKMVREQLQDMLNKRYQTGSSSEGTGISPRSVIQKTLASGYFMNVARQDDDGSYIRVKDNAPVKLRLHPSCGIKRRNAPRWIMFDELVRNKTAYVRTVTEVTPQWLLEVAPDYFNPDTLPEGPAKEELKATLNGEI